jgi:hypothetical protein
MTSTEPAHGGASTSADSALADALTTEYGVIYGYGVVSAHASPDINYLVSEAIHRHRQRRDQAVTMLTRRSVTPPDAAAGYQLPLPVNTPKSAARLAARMEDDAAVAWRAVLEQAQIPADRAFATTALTQCAVLAARWNQLLGTAPAIEAFPGGSA